MTRHIQGLLHVSQARQLTILSQYPASGGDKQCAASLTRGEPARTEGDEIVFDVHLPSSPLIVSLACSYNLC